MEEDEAYNGSQLACHSVPENNLMDRRILDAFLKIRLSVLPTKSTSTDRRGGPAGAGVRGGCRGG